jgi:hypothetical protein
MQEIFRRLRHENLCSNTISRLLGKWDFGSGVKCSLFGYIDLLLLLCQKCLLLRCHVWQKVNFLAQLHTSVESTNDGISIIDSNRSDIYMRLEFNVLENVGTIVLGMSKK